MERGFLMSLIPACDLEGRTTVPARAVFPLRADPKIASAHT